MIDAIHATLQQLDCIGVTPGVREQDLKTARGKNDTNDTLSLPELSSVPSQSKVGGGYKMGLLRDLKHEGAMNQEGKRLPESPSPSGTDRQRGKRSRSK